MKIPNKSGNLSPVPVSLARIVSEDSQRNNGYLVADSKSSKDS